MQTLENNPVLFERFAFAAASAKGFSDVSILTAGPAKGHGLTVDDTTIAQFLEAVQGQTVAAYLTHADAIDGEGNITDRLGQAIGMFSGFYRDESKVRADFKFLDSFIKNNPKEYATLCEMAANFPEKLGISPVMFARSVWDMGDGKEIAAKAGVEKPAGAVSDTPSMRILAVKSCDFVEEAAANYALFSKQVDETKPSKPPIMAESTILLSEHTKAITVKDGEIAALSAQHKDALVALNATHATALSALQTSVNDLTGKLAQASEKEKGLTAALAAKTTEADEAAKYDMRKAGAPALEVALSAHTQKLPAPAATDNGKWAQFTELQAKDPSSAQAFKAKYLSRK